MDGEVRGDSSAARKAGARRRWWPYSSPALALLAGLLVTAALTITAHALYTNNEKRLLTLRVREAEQFLTSTLPSVQTPLASAAALADATKANRKKFKAFISQYVGLGSTHPFISVSLWRSRALGLGPKVVLGTRPVLTPTAARSFLGQANQTRQLSVIGMLQGPTPRVGYALSGRGLYVAYGESIVPVHRYAPRPPNTAFSDLDYAIYLGAGQNPGNLIVTSVPHLPITGSYQAVMVPFGTSVLTLVMAPRRPLGGTLPQRLPWIILAAGLVLTLLASLLMVRLAQGRESAQRLAVTLEQIAAENRRLYGEQRDIALTLQHSLLPEELPEIPGADVSARYEAGEQGVEIGGDWYDVITLDADRVLMVVGDVAGRGLRAATAMAELRHAIQAYAVENDSPAAILGKLSRLTSVSDGGKLATVMCAALRISGHEVTLSSAGHLPPLLLGDGDGQFLDVPVGPPIGMEQGTTYGSETFPVPPGSTLLAFTDGLVERRGESIDEGLERLRSVATSNHSTLADLLSTVIDRMRHEPSADDTAIVGIRWRE